MFPLDWVREQFPALARCTVHLDNAAGSQAVRHAIDLVGRSLVEWNANKGAAHSASRAITDLVAGVRERTAEFIGAARPENIAFGPNATTLLTLVADGWRRRLQPGDEVVVTALDHHANVDPWRRLEACGVRVRTWPVRAPAWILDPADLAPMVGPRTRLLAVTAASNALGTIPDVRAVADLVHEQGGRVVVDAVHATPHLLPDVDALGADILVFSPYKVFGPHLGVLYLRDPLLDDLPHHGLSFMTGADPIVWEPGTQNHEAIAGWGGVLDYLEDLGRQCGATAMGRPAWRAAYDAIAAHERTLIERLLAGLDELDAERYGLDGADGRTATVAFNLPGVPARAVAEAAAAQGVAVSDGHYYAWTLMVEELGLRDGAVRASPVHYNRIADIDRLLTALRA